MARRISVSQRRKKIMQAKLVELQRQALIAQLNKTIPNMVKERLQ